VTAAPRHTTPPQANNPALGVALMVAVTFVFAVQDGLSR